MLKCDIEQLSEANLIHNCIVKLSTDVVPESSPCAVDRSVELVENFTSFPARPYIQAVSILIHYEIVRVSNDTAIHCRFCQPELNGRHGKYDLITNRNTDSLASIFTDQKSQSHATAMDAKFNVVPYVVRYDTPLGPNLVPIQSTFPVKKNNKLMKDLDGIVAQYSQRQDWVSFAQLFNITMPTSIDNIEEHILTDYFKGIEQLARLKD